MQDGMSPGILGNGMSPGIMGMQVSPTWGMPGSMTSAAGGGGNFARAEAALDGVRFSCRASPARIHEAAIVLRCRGAGTRAISTITLPALTHDIHALTHRRLPLSNCICPFALDECHATGGAYFAHRYPGRSHVGKSE